MQGIKLRRVELSEIQVKGCFLYQSGIYAVEKEASKDGELVARQIMAGWTDNPYDRWQHGSYDAQVWNSCCEVYELLFDQAENAGPAEIAN